MSLLDSLSNILKRGGQAVSNADHNVVNSLEGLYNHFQQNSTPQYPQQQNQTIQNIAGATGFDPGNNFPHAPTGPVDYSQGSWLRQYNIPPSPVDQEIPHQPGGSPFSQPFTKAPASQANIDTAPTPAVWHDASFNLLNHFYNSASGLQQGETPDLKNIDVRGLQKYLVQGGFWPTGAPQPDGHWSDATTAALKAYGATAVHRQRQQYPSTT